MVCVPVKQKKIHGFTPVKQKKVLVSSRLNKGKCGFNPSTIFRTYGVNWAGWIKIERGTAWQAQT
jgi:hypothetical protein